MVTFENVTIVMWSNVEFPKLGSADPWGSVTMLQKIKN